MDSNDASPFLANLPSRGLLSSVVTPSNPSDMRVYVCDHDSSPPEGQIIKTNQVNILIRSLTLKKQRESSAKDGTDASRKRAAEKVLDNRVSKRTENQINSRQEGSNSQAPNRDFPSLTVERLRALLRAKGLPTKGKKEELIARLRVADG